MRSGSLGMAPRRRRLPRVRFKEMVVAGRLTREGFIAYRRREEFPLLEVVRVPVLVEQLPLPPDRVWIREPRRPVYYRERSAPPQRSTVWRDEPDPVPPATPRTVRVAGGYKVIDDRDDASFDLFYGRKIERVPTPSVARVAVIRYG